MSDRQYTTKQMGDAGEMLVAAELTLAGIPALMVPDNWPSYDVIAQPPPEWQGHNQGEFAAPQRAHFRRDDRRAATRTVARRPGVTAPGPCACALRASASASPWRPQGERRLPLLGRSLVAVRVVTMRLDMLSHGPRVGDGRRTRA